MFLDIDFNHMVEECAKLNKIDSSEKKQICSCNIINNLYSVLFMLHINLIKIEYFLDCKIS